MATCKDCLHFDLCGTFTRPCMPDEANKSEILCRDFKNKADFVEVKHGKWEKLKYLGNCINPCQHTCGVCGKSYFDDNHNNYPFCPLCGAKMDGKNLSEIPTDCERSDTQWIIKNMQDN